MGIERFYTETASFYSITEPSPDTPAGGETLQYSVDCWINNKGGTLGYSNDKLTHDYDCTLKMAVPTSMSESWEVVHSATSARYKIVRANNPGYKDHHMTVYLQRKRDGSASN